MLEKGRQRAPGAGRKPGVPNRATSEAREAIAAFVDGNAHRLQKWLDQIADGVQDPMTAEYVVPPNPEKAFSLFQTVIEYHVPKLARTEVSGPEGGPVEQSISLNVVGVPGGFSVAPK